MKLVLRGLPGEGAKPLNVKPPKPAPKCPLCGKPAVPDYRPFCGKRCADVDLGRWLRGRYAVPGEPVRGAPDDEDDDG